MADVAGLVISVATAWKTCVQIFEIVDTSRKYGWDYEVLRIKLEVERVRLLAWGEAMGLAGLNNSQIIPDPRLRSREIQSMVMRVLGCIQNIFENSEALQNKYGLRPSASHKDKQVDLLQSIFKREYNTLLRLAKERQRSMNLARKTLWAVHDKRKFQSMVAEIKGFNENLETLFPDVKIKAAEAMRQDIGRSDQIQYLRLLQEATAGEDISESASVRLETLGATVTDISDIVSNDDDTVIWGESDEEDDSGWAVRQGEG
jgi:hypothetical protein